MVSWLIDVMMFMIHHVSEYHFILMLKLLFLCQLSNAQEDLLTLHNETREAIYIYISMVRGH